MTLPAEVAGVSPPLSPARTLIQLDAVDVRFGAVHALRGVSMEALRGQRIALVGSNGCGKSTLLRLLHGLVPASAGRVSREPAARQAMLFQRPHMLRTTARNNIALGLWLRRMTWREAQALALAALERVGLGDIADRNAKTLSGGQQQRLALARAWALRPDVLLLDEPTASLDPHAKRDVEELMHEFAQGFGVQGGEQPMTMVFASHNLGQVKRLASRVLYLEQGRVLADLPVDQFFDGELLAAQFPAAHLFVKGEFL